MRLKTVSLRWAEYFTQYAKTPWTFIGERRSRRAIVQIFHRKSPIQSKYNLIAEHNNNSISFPNLLHISSITICHHIFPTIHHRFVSAAHISSPSKISPILTSIFNFNFDIFPRLIFSCQYQLYSHYYGIMKCHPCYENHQQWHIPQIHIANFTQYHTTPHKTGETPTFSPKFLHSKFTFSPSILVLSNSHLIHEWHHLLDAAQSRPTSL